MTTRLLSTITDRWRWNYLGQSLGGCFRLDRQACPNCGCARGDVVHRKFIVTALARCPQCRILFRAPTDPPDFKDDFYEREYSSGFTTDCPSADELRDLQSREFRGTPKDFAPRIELLKALGVLPGQRILDYGASWGYATWQLARAGYETIGFEVSRSRARFAREMLGVTVHDDLNAVHGPFDAVFSSHVLEHVPSPTDIVQWARGVLVDGGKFIAFTPNGSDACRHHDPRGFHRRWGRVHPLYLNDEYYRQVFASQPLLLASCPFDLNVIRDWNRRNTLTLDLSGSELLVAAVI